MQNSVHPIKALRAVKDQAYQLKIHNIRSLSCDEYLDLIIANSANYDS